MMNALNGEPSYDAVTLRRILSSLLSIGTTPLTARPGVLSPTALSITIASDDTGEVGPGLAVISTVDGSYVTGLDAPQQFTLAPRDATNARYDKVILEVVDDAVERLSRVRILTGTPAALPSEPASPAGSIEVGLISVPNTAGGPAVLARGPAYTAANGGIIAVTDAVARARITGANPIYAHQLDDDSLWHKTTAGTWVKLNAGGAAYGRYYHSTSMTVATGGSYKTVPIQSTVEHIRMPLSGGIPTIPIKGVYSVSAWFGFQEQSTTGLRTMRLYKNGTPVQRTHIGEWGSAVLTTNLQLSPGDQITIGVFQTSGGTLNSDTTQERTGMSLALIHPTI